MLLFLRHNIYLILGIVFRRFVHGIITKYKRRNGEKIFAYFFVGKNVCSKNLLHACSPFTFLQLVWDQDP